ncbi:NAD-dependent epimerase/dehydratase family protein [Marinobacter qingdaonensis]|uniref:NAD-dependent epimerase/dehydratase family protein n=1 Tax=Marinobacter qingdaonensis TaxID=3108486 RepID=A0ABU5P072_9GAMM|nr:NAD-dependent epimerase/dehydratase family protein [Marinobacter sp. ASW11-75]MEA1081459.1 NAD-dependent epimerase/dehydratase family protein [Marinobacter sp. ASW11-75]
MTERILITGANGFVGKALCKYFVAHGYRVRGVVRGKKRPLADVEYAPIHDLASVSRAEWTGLLDDVQVVIHCAALVHQMQGVADPDEYYRVNTAATATLAEAAADAGVSRFIFLSTAKVLGEFTRPGRPFRADDSANPQDDYARSKWLAEQALTESGIRTDMDVVIIRPPLIYGSGVGGNFELLMKLVEKGLPLPFGSVDNKRSLLAINNLVDVLGLCLRKSESLSGTYLVSDGNDVSTRDLVTAMAMSTGKSVRLFPCPVTVLRVIGACLGKKTVIDRLCGDLSVECAPIQRALDWHPRHSLQTVLAYKEP